MFLLEAFDAVAVFPTKLAYVDRDWSVCSFALWAYRGANFACSPVLICPFFYISACLVKFFFTFPTRDIEVLRIDGCFAICLSALE